MFDWDELTAPPSSAQIASLSRWSGEIALFCDTTLDGKAVPSFVFDSRSIAADSTFSCADAKR
jgi:hypothetical protein